MTQYGGPSNGALMQNLRPSGGVGHDANFYPGEGGIATAGEYHNALEWRQQDNPNIAWDSIKFDRTLIDMEPEQGVPRYVTVEREAHTDYMVRRGLALIVNHGFAATPEGQKDFMYKVATIAGAVQETCDQAGIMALLRAKNEYRGHVVSTIRDAADAYGLFQHELWRFGIIQHSDRGWYHMDAEAQHVMRLENIQPDTWIVPPRMTSYAAMGQMAETEYYRAGQEARANLLKGEDNFVTFRGKSVYETRPYTLDVDGRKIDPLNRTRMIGDFFVVPCYDMRMGSNNKVYPVAYQGKTQVYCCDSDRFETFTWGDLVEQSEYDNISPDIFAPLSHQGHAVGFENFAHGVAPGGIAAAGDVNPFLKALAVHECLRTGRMSPQEFATFWNQGGAATDRRLMASLPIFLQQNLDSNMQWIVSSTRTEMQTVERRVPRALPTPMEEDDDGIEVEFSGANPFSSVGIVTRVRSEDVMVAHQPQNYAPTPIVPSATAYGHSKTQGITQSIDRAIHARFNVDPADTRAAAATWAAPLASQGVSPEIAAEAMRSALHDTFVRHLLDNEVLSEADIGTHVLHNADGTPRDSAAVADDLHRTFLRGGEPNSPFARVLQDAAPRAREVAAHLSQSAGLVPSGANALLGGAGRRLTQVKRYNISHQLVEEQYSDEERSHASSFASRKADQGKRVGEFKSQHDDSLFFTHVYTQKQLKWMWDMHPEARDKHLMRVKILPEYTKKILDKEAESFAGGQWPHHCGVKAAWALLAKRARAPDLHTATTTPYLGHGPRKGGSDNACFGQLDSPGLEKRMYSIGPRSSIGNEVGTTGLYHLPSFNGGAHITREAHVAAAAAAAPGAPPDPTITNGLLQRPSAFHGVKDRGNGGLGALLDNGVTQGYEEDFNKLYGARPNNWKTSAVAKALDRLVQQKVQYVYSLKPSTESADFMCKNYADPSKHNTVGTNGLQPVFPKLHGTDGSASTECNTYHGGMPKHMACPTHTPASSHAIEAPAGDFYNLEEDVIGHDIELCMEVMFLVGHRGSATLLSKKTAQDVKTFAGTQSQGELAVGWHSHPYRAETARRAPLCDPRSANLPANGLNVNTIRRGVNPFDTRTQLKGVVDSPEHCHVTAEGDLATTNLPELQQVGITGRPATQLDITLPFMHRTYYEHSADEHNARTSSEACLHPSHTGAPLQQYGEWRWPQEADNDQDNLNTTARTKTLLHNGNSETMLQIAEDQTTGCQSGFRNSLPAADAQALEAAAFGTKYPNYHKRVLQATPYRLGGYETMSPSMLQDADTKEVETRRSNIINNIAGNAQIIADGASAPKAAYGAIGAAVLTGAVAAKQADALPDPMTGLPSQEFPTGVWPAGANAAAAAAATGGALSGRICSRALQANGGNADILLRHRDTYPDVGGADADLGDGVNPRHGGALHGGRVFALEENTLVEARAHADVPEYNLVCHDITAIDFDETTSQFSRPRDATPAIIPYHACSDAEFNKSTTALHAYDPYEVTSDGRPINYHDGDHDTFVQTDIYGCRGLRNKIPYNNARHVLERMTTRAAYSKYCSNDYQGPKAGLLIDVEPVGNRNRQPAMMASLGVLKDRQVQHAQGANGDMRSFQVANKAAQLQWDTQHRCDDKIYPFTGFSPHGDDPGAESVYTGSGARHLMQAKYIYNAYLAQKQVDHPPEFNRFFQTNPPAGAAANILTAAQALSPQEMRAKLEAAQIARDPDFAVLFPNLAPHPPSQWDYPHNIYPSQLRACPTPIPATCACLQDGEEVYNDVEAYREAAILGEAGYDIPTKRQIEPTDEGCGGLQETLWPIRDCDVSIVGNLLNAGGNKLCCANVPMQNIPVSNDAYAVPGADGNTGNVQRVSTLVASSGGQVSKHKVGVWRQHSVENITDTLENLQNTVKNRMAMDGQQELSHAYLEELAAPYYTLDAQQKARARRFAHEVYFDNNRHEQHRHVASDLGTEARFREAEECGSINYMYRCHIGMLDVPTMPSLFSRGNIYNTVTSWCNFKLATPWAPVPSAAPIRVDAGPSFVTETTQVPRQIVSNKGYDTRSSYDLLCFRPFREYTMGTGILCKKGSELGNTFRGWADFQLTDNIIAKTHIGHFTFWHASVVTNPKMLFLAEDIFCTNYIGGEGKGVLSWREINSFHEDPVGTMKRNKASIICVPVPVGAVHPIDKRLNLNNPISLTGTLDPNTREMAGRQDAHRVDIGDYACNGESTTIIRDLMARWEAEHDACCASGGINASTNPRPYCPEDEMVRSHTLKGQDYSDLFSTLFGFHNMNHSVDYENSRTYETSCRLINTLCFHTMQKFQNPSSGRWEVTNLNTGHFGENGVYEGVKKIRCGFLDYFKEMNYQKAMAYGGLGI